MSSTFRIVTISALTHAAVAVAAVSCLAATNDPEGAILSFPKIAAWQYRPDAAVDSANALISCGKDAACAALVKVVKAEGGLERRTEVNEKACHLCRLIFRPTNSIRLLRPPRLGAPADLPYNSMVEGDWPDLPFSVAKDVPLSMSLGYFGSGIPEKAQTYLEYCKANGTFRTHLYQAPTSLTASNALSQILNSPAWKALKWKDEGAGWRYDLDENRAKKMLWKQVENMGRSPIKEK